MLKHLWPLTVFVAAMITFLAGCGPTTQPKGPGPEAPEHPAHSRPLDLELFPGDGKMMVQWRVAGSEIISGFDIYVSEHPVTAAEAGAASSSVKPFNSEVYPGDTNPEDSLEQYRAENLQPGLKYFVWVRIVRPDGTLSEPSEVLTAICGPRGEFDLGPRYQSENDGYSFEKKKNVHADASDNDLFYFNKDGIDYLASPTRLNGYLRSTKLLLLPLKGTFDQVRRQVAKLGAASSGDRIAITDGDWILAVTAEGNNALVHVISLKGKEARLFFALCPVPGEMLF